MWNESDTIAAISTAKGVGALSIVRISGTNTSDIIKCCFSQKKSLESHRAYHGYWKRDQRILDEVVMLYFSPGSGFTGEESAEIICHGGIKTTELVLNSILESGARLARPGEFTYRAVMNDRINLTQAESVLDLIQARTERGVARALKNLQGGLTKSLNEIESEILFVLANLEASIDFTAEDIQPVSYMEMSSKLDLILERILKILETYVPGRLESQGLRTVLVGRPNAGKSSLLNTLLGMDRSIVGSSPGTTRDTIEVDYIIEGTLFRLIDTAGLRTAETSVEDQGIQRTYYEMNSADIILYVVDSAQILTNDDVEQIKRLKPSQTLVCLNKADLNQSMNGDELKKFGLQDFSFVKTHALDLEGVRDLRIELTKLAPESLSPSDIESEISTPRQKEALTQAMDTLKESLVLLKEDASPEIICMSLRESLSRIQETLGKNVSEDVMDRVFKEFCIGK